MGAVRVYDKDLKQWIVVSTSDANATSVRSEKLLPEGTEVTNVEQVLMDMRDEIDTMKGNISWLALHGGGGSGGGTGGGSVSAEVMVNGLPTGSSIVLENDLQITVQSNSGSLLWDITVIGKNKILKTSNNVTRISLTKEELTKAGITSTFQLAITAVNNNTLTQTYWNGIIYIANVSINTNVTYNDTYDNYLNSNLYLSYSYNIGVVGTYKLLVNGKEVWRDILNTTSGNINVPLLNFPELQTGSNSINSQLIMIDNENIFSSVITTLIVLTADVPIISCLNISADSLNPTNYTINPSGITTIPLSFIVHYSGGNYKVIIHAADEQITVESFSNVEKYKQYNQTYNDESYVLIENEYDKDITFSISILDSEHQKIYTKPLYIVTSRPKYELLDNKRSDNLLLDFNSYEGYINNGIWEDLLGNTMTIYNINEYSQSIQANKIMRFQNASYGAIDISSLWSRLINKNIWEFTLSICYKADFHPDDDRTILQFAKLYGKEEGNYTPSSGIVIRDHMLYIGPNSLILQDNELTNITITFSHTTESTTGKAFVYIDGVVEAVFDISRDSILPSGMNNIYLAAHEYDGSSMFYTDTDIYRVMLYDACLNPYEVLFDYLNTKAYSNLLNGNLDDRYIVEGLQQNFINVSDDGSKKSLLWDTTGGFDNNNSQFLDCFTLNNLISVSNNKASIISNITDYKLSIPIMLIDVSGSDAWTWENFIAPKADLKEVDNCTFQYYDQNQTNASILDGIVSVSLQGTSTLADFIKNLNIKFQDSSGNKGMFIPKPTWFPEEVYTLKADIVDSSHSLNAAVGKFVNEEFGLSYNEDGTLAESSNWYPYSNTVLEEFQKQKRNSVSAIQKYFPHATLKHGIEGFPVFLIMRFHSLDANEIIVKSLGIYQFILGRDSARNLGYEIITKVTSKDENNPLPDQLTYPYLHNNIEIISDKNKGYWIEFGQNDSFPDDMGFQELTRQEFESKKFTGAFWQNDTDSGIYYNTAAEIKYSNLENEAVTDLRQLTPFTDFINNIIALPVTTRRYSSQGESNLLRNTYEGITYPKYRYVKDEQGNGIWELIEGVNVTKPRGDDLEGVLNDLHMESITKYFVIAMFLGLIDNFQKNMPIKIFQKKGSTEFEPPILGIYDTDTGCGGTNQAVLNVSEEVWLSPFTNINKSFTETSITPDKNKVYTIIANANKLWYLDSDAVNYNTYGGDKYGGSLFTEQWYSLLSHLNIGSQIEDLANKFIDEYFIPQTAGCGELLFNLTYFCKYISSYKNATGAFVSQYNKLNGRRIKQVRNWLKKRVKFLDSMFTALGVHNLATSQKSGQPASINFDSGSVPEFAITTNYPIISKVDSNGTMGRYVYCRQNETTPIYWGSDEETLGNNVGHTISYSDAIQRLGSDDYKLSNIGFRKDQGSSLPYLTELDLSGCDYLSEVSSQFWEAFKSNGKSELRTINCENTAKVGTAINFPLLLENGFEKLQHIKIQNSCVSELRLPTNPNVPLLTFEIQGSQLVILDLNNQNLINNLNLEGCNKLTNLKISNCAALTELSLNATQSSLGEVSISSSTFQKFTCTNNKKVKTISIIADNLTDVTITDCTNLTSVTVYGNKLNNLNLSGCTKLTTLNIVAPKETINTLNLKGTKISVIQYNGVANEEGILDLSQFIEIGEFNISGNTTVQYIQFTNNPDKPIRISNTFASCSNLYRVYGYLDIQCSSVFNGCTNFSIHGSDVNTVTYLGKSVIDSDKRVKHPEEISGITSNKQMIFQPGIKVTNLKFSSTSANNNFYNTNCTLFDVYYVFYNIGNLQSFVSTFRSLKNSKFVWSSTVDNSPNKKIFVNGSNITNLSDCFRGSCDTIRLISPSHSYNEELEDYEITADDGIFSPLINCESLNYTFSEQQLFVDRFIFRRRNNNYKFKNIGYFYPNILTEDVRNLSYNNSVNIDTWIINNPDTAGNFGEFFINCPHIESIHGFADNTKFINYDLTYESGQLGIPEKVTSLTGVLRSQYATGNLVPENLFKTPNNITKIFNSFYVSKELTDSMLKVFTPATFKITSNILSKFTKLTNIGYTTGYNSGTIHTCSFNGIGLKKTIDQSDFPFDILEPCKSTITEFRGFFQDVTSDLIKSVELPGDLFKNTTKITQVGALFKNFGIQYSLTSGSFTNCTGLKGVEYMFASNGTSSSSSIKANYESSLEGHIPSKLFYHGSNIVRKSYKTIDINFDPYEIVDYDVNGTPIYKIDQEKDNVTPIDFTINVKNVNANITNMEGCFLNCNCSAYFNEEPEIEENPNYRIGNYLWSSNKWVPITADTNQKTFIWEYDGVNIPEDYEGENLDDDHTDTSPEVTIFGSDNTGTLNYMCAPDLLRYCANSSSTNITYLFKDSGHNSNGSLRYTNFPENPNYGIKGRIPPYLLKPVSNINSIAGMFQNCKHLSYYTTEEDKDYIIPQSFFKYTSNLTNLSHAFYGLMFPKNINLNVFNQLKQSLNIERIFMFPLFKGSPTIKGVFKNNKVSNLYGAFAINDNPQKSNSLNNMDRTQSVTFDDIFGTYTGKDLVTYVFDGYNKDYVKFNNPSLNTDLQYGNYRYSDGTNAF